MKYWPFNHRMAENLWYVSSPLLLCWSRFWGLRDLAVLSQAACAGPFDLECLAASSTPEQLLARSWQIQKHNWHNCCIAGSWRVAICAFGFFFWWSAVQVFAVKSQLRKDTVELQSWYALILFIHRPTVTHMTSRDSEATWGALLSTRCLQKVPLCFARARPDPPVDHLTCGLCKRWAWHSACQAKVCNFWCQDYLRIIWGLSGSLQHVDSTAGCFSSLSKCFDYFAFLPATCVIMPQNRNHRPTLHRKCHPQKHQFHSFPLFSSSQFLNILTVSHDLSRIFPWFPWFSGRWRAPVLQSLVLPIQQQLRLGRFSSRDLADLAWSTARLELWRSGADSRGHRLAHVCWNLLYQKQQCVYICL